jgi:acyl dehydratase
MMSINIDELTAGKQLAPLVKPPITREQLAAYADASGDHNLIHLNDDAARMAGLDGVIAHGMLSMGFLGQYASAWMRELPGKPRLGRIKVRFSDMVRPGDVLTCKGVIKKVEAGESGTCITLDIWAENQHGKKVTGGDAEVVVA